MKKSINSGCTLSFAFFLIGLAIVVFGYVLYAFVTIAFSIVQNATHNPVAANIVGFLIILAAFGFVIGAVLGTSEE